MKIKYSILVGLTTLALVTSACRPMAQPTASAGKEAGPTATLPATKTPVLPTATPEPTATNTPKPTATSTPDKAATAAAYATATADAIIGEIDKELQKYDLSTDEGQLGFIHDPVSIKVNTYAEEKYVTDYPAMVFKNFALHADVTWTSKTGLAGCYFIFRSEPDNFEKGKQYRVYMMRLQGLPLWDVEYYAFGQFQRNIAGRVHDTGYLDSEQGSTNKMTLIVQDSKIATYANGERLGIFTDSKLTEGAIAFATFQESGETTCTYENIWVWELP